MISKIREPKSQKEIDRNLFILTWTMILPSVGFLFFFKPLLLTLLLIGGLSRLLIIAVRLPNGKRGFYGPAISGFMVLVALMIQLPERFHDGRIFLLYFWAVIVYAEMKFFRYNLAGSPEADQI